MTVVVCVGVGLIHAGIFLVLAHDMRPRWTFVSRRRSLILALAGVLAVVIAAGALNTPSRASHAWSEFKQPSGGPGKGTERLGSIAGESRYQFWSAAVKEAESKPLTGSGSGTFQFCWAVTEPSRKA